MFRNACFYALAMVLILPVFAFATPFEDAPVTIEGTRSAYQNSPTTTSAVGQIAKPPVSNGKNAKSKGGWVIPTAVGATTLIGGALVGGIAGLTALYSLPAATVASIPYAAAMVYQCGVFVAGGMAANVAIDKVIDHAYPGFSKRDKLNAKNLLGKLFK